jgi:hypothetical protein
VQRAASYLPLARMGKAFDKPGVNGVFKKDVRALAQQQAAAATTANQGCPELAELAALVAETGLPGERKADANRAIIAALRKIDAGQNPLSDLNPPPSCAVCVGRRPGATHHFFCEARARNPAAAELAARESIKRKLVQIYRARQMATVRGAFEPTCAIVPLALAPQIAMHLESPRVLAFR